MLLSMTGFGKAIVEIPNKKITVEIKSLNSKQLDLNARVPAAYREKELEMRNRIARQLERGKVDLVVHVETAVSDTPATLNIPLMAQYKRQVETMSQELSIPLPADWYSVLLRMPETMKTESASALSEEECEALYKAVDEAAKELMAFRREEGKKLEEFFAQRIENIRTRLSEVPQYEGERVAKIRTRIEEGLAKIKEIDYDKGRLEQEMIFYIEKLDITEEKVRLKNHCDYFREVAANEEAPGRKLGFIAQEMGREINTLGSKSNEANMQILVVKMKDELEKIKEQILNIL